MSVYGPYDPTACKMPSEQVTKQGIWLLATFCIEILLPEFSVLDTLYNAYRTTHVGKYVRGSAGHDLKYQGCNKYYLGPVKIVGNGL